MKIDLSHSKKIAILIVTTVLFLSIGALKIVQVGDTSMLINESAPEKVTKDQMESIFGSSDMTIIVSKDIDISQPKDLEKAFQFVSHLEGLKEIHEVTSFFSEKFISTGAAFSVDPIIENPPYTEEEASEVVSRITTNRSNIGNLISLDLKNIIVGVEFSDGVGEDLMRRTLDDAIDKVNQQGHWIFSGIPIVNSHIKKQMDRDLMTLIPFMVILIALVLFLVFKNTIVMLLPLINVGLATGAAMGFMGLTGISLNVVTHTIPLLITAIGTAYSIHYLSPFFLSGKTVNEKEYADKILTVGQHIMPTIILTGVTTAVGFLANTLSPVVVIREFGVAATVGIIVAIICSVYLIPSCLFLFRKSFIPLLNKRLKKEKANQNESTADKLLSKLSSVTISYRWFFLFFTAIICAFMIWSMPKLQSNYRTLGYFESGSKVSQDALYISRNAGGISDFNIVIDTGKEDGVKSPKVLAALNSVSSELLQKYSEDIKVTFSISDMVKEMRRRFNDSDNLYSIPKGELEIQQYFEVYSWTGDVEEDLSFMIDPEFRYARLHGRFIIHEKGDDFYEKPIQFSQSVMNEAAELLKKKLGNDYSVISYGTIPIWSSTLVDIVKGQQYSIVGALLAVFFITWIVLKSLVFATLALIPIIISLLVNFGIMSIFGIDLDIATSLVSALIIGIGIDDAIHFILGYRRFRSSGNGSRDSILKTMQSSGKAIILTSIALIAGYGVMILSSFKPIGYFGILNVLAITVATFSTLFVLPAVISIIDKKN